MSLLKATLESPLYTHLGAPPPIRFTLGGRQEFGPHWAPLDVQIPVRQWDIQAAYARTLGNLRYGGYWAKVDKDFPFELDASDDAMMYIRAKVRIPDYQPKTLGPLAERGRKAEDAFMALLFPTLYPTGRDLQGIWTWQELAVAEAWGCKILRIIEGWTHVSGDRPFIPWLRAIEQGRAMEGFAGLLAKATGNATWGQFAIRKASRTIVKYDPKAKRRTIKPLRMPGGGNPSQRAPDLAEFVCGLVRAQLYQGMRIAGDSLISAHTDGLWKIDDNKIIPGWRSKEKAIRLRLINPQELAYRCKGESSDHYVVAGLRADRAPEFFEQSWQEIQNSVEYQGRPYTLRERDRVAPKPFPVLK
jgi:hypothetical protein